MGAIILDASDKNIRLTTPTLRGHSQRIVSYWFAIGLSKRSLAGFDGASVDVKRALLFQRKILLLRSQMSSPDEISISLSLSRLSSAHLKLENVKTRILSHSLREWSLQSGRKFSERKGILTDRQTNRLR